MADSALAAVPLGADEALAPRARRQKGFTVIGFHRILPESRHEDRTNLSASVPPDALIWASKASSAPSI
jgi:hypothetical protein